MNNEPVKMQERATRCKTCELIARRDSANAPLWDSIYRTPYWDVVHSFNTALPGWICLIARRHIAAIDEMTEDEAAELGSLIRRVSVALRSAANCEKTYAVQFAEAAGHNHVHFHVVPRVADLPEDFRGPLIFRYLGVPVDQRVSESAMNELALKIRESLQAQTEK